jgi:hypothetical protein
VAINILNGPMPECEGMNEADVLLSQGLKGLQRLVADVIRLLDVDGC